MASVTVTIEVLDAIACCVKMEAMFDTVEGYMLGTFDESRPERMIMSSGGHTLEFRSCKMTENTYRVFVHCNCEQHRDAEDPSMVVFHHPKGMGAFVRKSEEVSSSNGKIIDMGLSTLLRGIAEYGKAPPGLFLSVAGVVVQRAVKRVKWRQWMSSMTNT